MIVGHVQIGGLVSLKSGPKQRPDFFKRIFPTVALLAWFYEGPSYSDIPSA